MASKNKFEIHGDIIHISRDTWKKLASTTYREDYYEELTSVTWTESNSYLRNAKYGYLHRYIMAKWYGVEVLSEMEKRGWIVDHMNNNGFDCCISNLEFLATRHNVAKGQTVDVESKELCHHIALNMFKDFTTGLYQISIGFNDAAFIWSMEDSKYKAINVLYLLYNCDYRLVINDAEQILLEYELNKRINISKLSCIEWDAKYPPDIILTDKEKQQGFIQRDGQIYMVIGNGKSFIHSASFKKRWKPDEKNDITKR